MPCAANNRAPILATGLCLLLALVSSAAWAADEEGAPPSVFGQAASSSPLGSVAAVAVEPPGYEELLLEARVNGLPPAATLLALRDSSGRLWIPAENFSYWDMVPPATRREIHGRNFHLLDDQPGLGYRLDMASLSLAIEADPQWFEARRVDSGINGGFTPPQVDPGGFVNYDLSVTHHHSDTQAAGFFEGGVFGRWGVVTAGALARSDPATSSDRIVRLDTTWTRDLPQRRASLRAGDAVGGASSWGRPVRFGGIQFATNFATQPGFITFPLPTLQGEAALPSTLDLYVNGMRRMSSEVETGPFSIPDLPAVTGYGDVQLVVTDLLGRQQVITDSFYVSSRLLKAGLHEYSYEVGLERNRYGTASFDYGRAFAVGTHRLGVSDVFTGEARVEALSGQYTAGLGGALLLGEFGVANASLAASSSQRGEGALLKMGFEHSSRRLGFGFSLEVATRDFAQIGLREGELAPRSRGNVHVSLSLLRAGSISLSYVRRDERDPELGRFESVNATYQASLGSLGHLAVFASRIEGLQDDTLFGINFTRSLGERRTSSLNGNFSRGSDQLIAQVQQSLPVGTGLGYQVRAGLMDQGRLDAGLSAQNNYGTVRVEASRAGGDTGLRASASGGVAWLDGGAYLSRRIDSSFAVVDVGGFEGVRIYADNQHVASTNSRGRALLPTLRSYEKNPIAVEVGDMPMGAKIEQVEYEVVPFFRSGTLVSFDISRSRNAIFRLHRSGGEPVPAGSIVHGPGGTRFPVGYDGTVFVTNMEPGARLSARWNGTRCDFDMPAADADEPLPDLGVLSCRESAP